ncbi:MAG: PVC-type heme-binding CxxCH protein [Planctomycetota bacterium]
MGFPVLSSYVSESWNEASAADLEDVKPLPPEVAEASKEPAEAMATIRIPVGWKINLWAAEPDVANVVAFAIDDVGGIYACETFRQNRGVTDNRAHDRRWLLADLQSKTVQDRIDYHKRLLGEGAITYAQHDDRVRYLTDSDGDGRADQSVVVADGFNHLEEGTGAGVLAVGESVYYTCIPKLWKLTDEDGDHRADKREVLSDGYGVRVAFRGHDLHGLIRGYDGRLYFTIGDRGYHLRTPEGKVLSDAVSGAVFRCELDGSGLEVFAEGLRNPQELAFNDDGDWFTVDNNSDSGDQARIVHLIRGSDAGWRMYYQYIPDRGPFNRERIWEPANEEQPAFIVPPVSNFTDGPSGLAYYPGTGFGELLKDKFLICDFRGGPSNSGIRTFRVERSGASYKQVSDEQPIWTCLATDVAFGPDGALYVSDWVDGWDGLGKARIYRITAPQLAKSENIESVQNWLAEKPSTASVDRLLSGLSHVDRRVRLRCQWELAERGEAKMLIDAALDPEANISRLHAVWGLGHLMRVGELEKADRKRIEEVLAAVIASGKPRLQVAAATIAGELKVTSLVEPIRQLLSKETAHVQAAAIAALGLLGDADSLGTVLSIASESDDPALRHVCSLFASQVVSSQDLSKLTSHPSVRARMCAVIALRRQKSGDLSGFLTDEDSNVVLEAARAIYDLPIDFAMRDLAVLIETPSQNPPLIRRVLNANYRIGDADAAKRLAKYATSAEVDPKMRIEALEMLGEWLSKNPIDRVTGNFFPLQLKTRQKSDAANAVEPVIDLLMAAPDPIRLKAIEVAADLGIKKISGELVTQFQQAGLPSESRSRALLALSKIDQKSALDLAQAVPSDSLRGSVGLAVLETMVKLSPQGKLPNGDSITSRLTSATESSDLRVQQKAWDLLARSKESEASQALTAAVDSYLNGELAPELELNVLEAASGLIDDALAARLDEHQQALATNDPLGKWLSSLAGGDIAAGKKLFFEKTELSCVRCHKVDRAGGEVGPNLTTIGKKNDARYLLEAICIPDAKIAEGYETVVVIDLDGRVHGGILKQETDDFIELILADGSQKRILQDDIEVRKKGNSSMPADLTKHLSARELRDLVAYLVSLKVDPRAETDVE